VVAFSEAHPVEASSNETLARLAIEELAGAIDYADADAVTD
jgi:hypothetical protein